MFFTLQAPFIGWPMVMAMKVLTRQLETPFSQALVSDDRQNTIKYIGLLLEALDRVEDRKGHWHASTIDVAAILKERTTMQETCA